jgi:hypothetical protein
MTCRTSWDRGFLLVYRLLHFSWDNRRQVGIRKLKRLDRFYCFSSSSSNPASHVIRYDIIGDCTISDHLLVRLSLELQAEIPQGARYKVNNYFLEDASIVSQLYEVWGRLPSSLAFFGKFRRLIKWYKVFC